MLKKGLYIFFLGAMVSSIAVMLPSCKLVPSQAKNVSESPYALAGKLLAANAAETRKGPEKKLLDDLRPIIDEARVCFGDSTVAPSESLTEIIDSMALELSSKLFMVKQPGRIVAALRKTVFDEGRITCDRGDHDVRNLLPQMVLRRGHGSALGISLVLLALGQKLDLPLYGVAAPEHFFIRFDDGREKINIDPLKKGRALTDSWYKTRCNIPDSSYYTLKNLDTREVVAYVRFAMAGIYKSRGLFAKAAQNYEFIITELPDFPDVYVNLGMAYDTLGQIDKSLAYFLKAKTLRNSRKNLSADIGKLFIKRKNYAQAIIEYQNSLKENPNSPELLYGLGQAYFFQNDYENAYKQLMAAVSVAEPYPAAYRLLAAVCEKTGENSKAAQYRALAVSRQ
jgi:regulator of sirC expression with transglutaminase-like and TPR domain